MKKKMYRMASWWLLWEDLIFPENGIEEKVVRRAEKFKAAGIDAVVIFGCHFRWDFIYNWERLHHLLSFIVDTCHKQEIKVFDHHSANMTHRVGTLEEYRNINMKNRHHVPVFPSREFASSITFNGNKLDDFRMLSVQDGKPCCLDTYNAEIFCMNNNEFVAAYKKYVEKLLQTGIDGLMCDDIFYYPSWNACGCKHCRKKFRNKYGHNLPPANDNNFWGNYESPEFKDWMNMRFHDPLDFLTVVKETVGNDFPLMSCCSSSSLKSLDGNGLNAGIMSKSLNHIMLEICGEIITEKSDYSKRLPDLMLHKAIAKNKGIPNINLGYAHNPDSAFIVWAINKMFASNPWISTLTGRFNVPEEIRKDIPDEADIIREAYNFEKHHEDLFCGESAADLAVLFSLDNLLYNGCAQSSYSQPWHDTVIGLFKQNIQFDVVLNIPAPDEYPVLLLVNFDCVSSETGCRLRDYMKNGGTVIAVGLLGFRNERGVLSEKTFLADSGIELVNEKFDRKIPAADLFDRSRCTPQNSFSSHDIYCNGRKIEADQWINFGSLHWLPETSTDGISEKVIPLLPSNDIEVSCPENWTYRIMKDGDRYFIHLLNSNIETVTYENFRNNLINEPIVEKLNFIPGTGKMNIFASKTKAILHSPDLQEEVILQNINGTISFDINTVKRYSIIEVL